MTKSRIILILVLVLIFLIFALPIPDYLIGFIMSLRWLINAFDGQAHMIERVMSMFAVAISATYVVSFAVSVLLTLRHKKITVRTFIPLFHVAVSLLFFVALKPAIGYVDRVSNMFAFEKNDFTVIYEEDTHGGFIGDGRYILILDCSENKDKAKENINKWHYMSNRENVTEGTADNSDSIYSGYFPQEYSEKVSNGRYIFKNRTDYGDDDDAPCETDRVVRNYSIAVYDSDNDLYYYYASDT